MEILKRDKTDRVICSLQLMKQHYKKKQEITVPCCSRELSSTAAPLIGHQHRLSRAAARNFQGASLVHLLISQVDNPTVRNGAGNNFTSCEQ